MILKINYSGGDVEFDTEEIINIKYSVEETGPVEIDRNGKVSVQPVSYRRTCVIDFDILNATTLEKIQTLVNAVDANGQPEYVKIYYDILNPTTYISGYCERTGYTEQYLNIGYAASSRTLTYTIG